jgi:hypothetical protein
MAVKVLELHHHGIRVGPSPADVKKAYVLCDVLGLDADQGRPVPTIDGFWMDAGDRIHLMGADAVRPPRAGHDLPRPVASRWPTSGARRSWSDGSGHRNLGAIRSRRFSCATRSAT